MDNEKNEAVQVAFQAEKRFDMHKAEQPEWNLCYSLKIPSATFPYAHMTCIPCIRPPHTAVAVNALTLRRRYRTSSRICGRTD